MTDDHSPDAGTQGLLGALLSPLRAPQRVVSEIESIASALLSLQRDASKHLASLDERAGELVAGLRSLRAPLERVDRNVTELQKLEQVITERMDGLRQPLDRLEGKMTDLDRFEQNVTQRIEAIDVDLNARILTVEQELHALRAPIDQMSAHLAQVVQLLPEPSDGPIARIKDTFSSS